jgi:hypothetical protein
MKGDTFQYSSSNEDDNSMLLVRLSFKNPWYFLNSRKINRIKN